MVSCWRVRSVASMVMGDSRRQLTALGDAVDCGAPCLLATTILPLPARAAEKPSLAIAERPGIAYQPPQSDWLSCSLKYKRPSAALRAPTVNVERSAKRSSGSPCATDTPVPCTTDQADQ